MPGKFFLYKYEVGDVIRMKKKHPCGSFEWTLTRVGAECKMTCNGCGRLAVMEKKKKKKSTVEVKRKSDDLD